LLVSSVALSGVVRVSVFHVGTCTLRQCAVTDRQFP